MSILEVCKEKVENVKKKAKEETIVLKETGKILWNNLKDNPEKFGTFIGAAGSLIIGGIGFISAAANRSEERCRIHDEQTGFDWNTTHELTNQELLKVNKRLYDEQIKGLGEALEAEGYLKKEKKRR